MSVLLLSLCVLGNICVAQQPSATSRQKAVEDFLTTWLVRKNIPASLRHFRSNAFANEYVFDCACCTNEFTSQAVRSGSKIRECLVKQFLQSYSGRIKGTRLKNLLFLKSNNHPEKSEELEAKLRKWILNRPERDRFYLVDYRMLKPEVERQFGRPSLDGAFFSVIQYRVLNEDERYGDDMVVILLWMLDRGAWKVTSIKVVCN